MPTFLADVVFMVAVLPCFSQATDGTNRFVLESFESGSGPPLVMLGGGTRGADEFIPEESQPETRLLARNNFQ